MINAVSLPFTDESACANAGRVKAPASSQTIAVYGTVAEPSPLIAPSHEIEVRARERALVVTERIVVANRSLRSYIGPESNGEAPSVTLRLSVPPEFEKVTFDKEFFGRQFQLQDQRLETQIPWPPGNRELRFTYWLPREAGRLLRRPLDLPTERVRVTVVGELCDEATCNLSWTAIPRNGGLAFESDGRTLPRGHVIELRLQMPAPWTEYARWAARGVLALLVLGTSAALLRRRRSGAPEGMARRTLLRQRAA